MSVSSSKVTKSYNFSVISNSSANESFETHSKLQSSTLAIQSAFEKDEDDSVIYECDSTCASTLGKDHSLFLNPPYPKYGILQNHKIMKPQISSTKGLTWPDHTLEILMTSLNQSRAKMFFKDNAYNEDGTMKVVS